MTKIRTKQTVTFFTPWQIYVASCLGSPLAAAWLVVRNHRARISLTTLPQRDDAGHGGEWCWVWPP